MMQREQWHLTEGLIFAHFAVFILSTMVQGQQEALALIPGFVKARPWTLVTYQFIHGSSMFWFFISMLVLWIMAKPLEDSWGSPRFLVFWLIATFGSVISKKYFFTVPSPTISRIESDQFSKSVDSSIV